MELGADLSTCLQMMISTHHRIVARGLRCAAEIAHWCVLLAPEHVTFYWKILAIGMKADGRTEVGSS
ncbi:hypothetical protein O9992_03660 [Vibrio lentus]|nr:hypothetical protein [Vibrio lentus]